MKKLLPPLLLWLAGLSSLAATSPSRPNFLVILADDAGYADFGFQGGGIDGDYAHLTPNLDRLAASGVRFRNGYVTQPYCCPSRAALLTGRYQHRYGFENNVGDTPEAGLATTERTAADLLKQRGYRTYAVGKWHLGYQPRFHPNQRGFDDFFGFLAGARTYWPDNTLDDDNRLQTNGVPVTEAKGTYLTDVLGAAAADYIASHANRFPNQPFFMYLAFNGVHTPLNALPGDLAHPDIQRIADPNRQTNAAMTLALDRAVGEVMRQLNRTGLATNTLTVFLSDNGGPEDNTGGDLALESPNWSDNGPLRGRKTLLYEGGVRVPFVLSWPGVVPTNTVLDDMVISLDLLPTFLAAAGGADPLRPRLDGVNLLPRLTGATTAPFQRCFVWRAQLPDGEQRAVRQGDWKLYRGPGGTKELYHLATDLGEANDLASAFPEKVAELSAAHTEWSRDMIEPLWGLGALGHSPGVRVTASDAGYLVENGGGGYGYLGYELREPLSLANDWALAWSMECQDVPGGARNGHLLLSDRPIPRETNLIRAGMALATPTSTLSIGETHPNDGSERAVPGPVAGRYYFRLDYSATNRALGLRYGTNQPSLRYEKVQVTRVLAGEYTAIRYLGYSLQGQVRTRFSSVLGPPNPLAPPSAPSWTRLQMARDYRAGYSDADGHFVGGTELMSLVPHQGKLYAGLAYWNETGANPGAQVLVKDSPGAPWRQDVAFGKNFIRAECLRSLTLTTDKNGVALNPPVTLLMAGVGAKLANGDYDPNAYVFIRNDVTGTWTPTVPGTVSAGQGAARFVFEHKDRVTGVHKVFCGYGELELVSGGYDTKSGSVVWDSAAPELIGSERMLSGGDCNGHAYACIGSDGNPNNTNGGVFWREDGPHPAWHLVIEFPDHPEELYEDVRAFTPVPHPKGFDYDVALVALNSHSKIVRLDPIGGDPRNGHLITEELDLRTFLGDQWDGGTPIADNIICAYNDMPALPDPATGRSVRFLGLFIKEHPAGTNTVEYNNTYYLIRRPDATYEWGRVIDPAEPLPSPFLRACRTASLSPFPGETDRVLYLGGFDAGGSPWHNTAWIYRAVLPDERAHLRLDGPTPVVGIDATFGWNYRLEASPTPGDFQPLGEASAGRNTLLESRDPSAPAERAFYRWRISR